MLLYHATTEKKARMYRESGRIIKPVRGFTTLQGAMAWAIKVGRKETNLAGLPLWEATC